MVNGELHSAVISMAKRRGAGSEIASERPIGGRSDGAKALSMWRTHGRIIKPRCQQRADEVGNDLQLEDARPGASGRGKVTRLAELMKRQDATIHWVAMPEARKRR